MSITSQVEGLYLSDNLMRMQERCSSIILNYGEDNKLWECSIICGGKRFTSHRQLPSDALYDVKKLAEKFYSISFDYS